MKTIPFLIAIFCLTGCYSDYHKKVISELDSGVRYDSLFLGLNFGMTKDEFYQRCWELNKQGKMWHSSKNNAVLYKIKDYEYELKMEFYPDFHEGKAYQMPLEFQFVGWSPLAKVMSYENLERDVIDLMKKWYGTDFLRMEKSPEAYALVWVHGNRRIILTQKDDHTVKVVMTDMIAEEELEGHQENQSSVVLDKLQSETEEDKDHDH